MSRRSTIQWTMAGILTIFILAITLPIRSHAADAPSKGIEIPPRGLGCWVQKKNLDNPFIYSDLFSWYVTDISNMERFNNRHNKPLFMSYAGRDLRHLMKRMGDFRSRIVGVVWDKEQREPQESAERDLRTAYAKAKELGLAFAVVTSPGPDQSLKTSGISYSNAKQFSDFLMPMMYVQWFEKRRGVLEKLIDKERAATRVPIVALLTLETTRSKHPPQLTPEEVVSIYRGLPVDGFCVYNVTNLNEKYIGALRSIGK